MQMRKLNKHRSGSSAQMATAAVCFLRCGGMLSGANLHPPNVSVVPSLWGNQDPVTDFSSTFLSLIHI